MKYVDTVYGEQEIGEPVILDLIRTASMQRLKKVDQAGFPRPFRPEDDPVTRFEHSIGVYLLLRKFGASLEEQIAGLLHDVSHSAFSHCIDYMGSHEAQQKQSHQDDVFEAFVRKSEIPSILDRYGIDTSYILDDSHFPLKETMLPDLCADRIDYSLRTAIASHACSTNDVRATLECLTADGGRWIFRTQEAALRYATLFSYLNKNRYGALWAATMLYTVGSVLRHSLENKYITYEDLYTTDDYVLEKVERHGGEDRELQKLLDRMYARVPIVHDPSRYHAQVFVKSRAVDPLCYHEGALARLSDCYEPWKSRLQEEIVPVSFCLQFGGEEEVF